MAFLIKKLTDKTDSLGSSFIVLFLGKSKLFLSKEANQQHPPPS